MKKMKIILTVTLLAIAICVNAVTETEVNEFQNLVDNYYRAPDVKKAIEFIPLAEKIANEDPEGRILPLFGFYLGACVASPAQKDDWMAAKENLKTEWLVKAISNGLEGKKLEDLFADKPEQLGPEILDLFWGYFFATGDREAPRRIIHRGGMTVPDEEGVIDLTAMSARWSALSLAGDHPIVMEELRSFEREADEKSKRNFFGEKTLDEIMASRAKGKSKAAEQPSDVKEDMSSKDRKKKDLRGKSWITIGLDKGADIFLPGSMSWLVVKGVLKIVEYQEKNR